VSDVCTHLRSNFNAVSCELCQHTIVLFVLVLVGCGETDCETSSHQ